MFSETFDPTANGISTSVRTLIDELRSAHHNVVLVAPHYQDYEDESPFVLRVPSIQTRLNADYPLAYPWFRTLRRDIARIEPDIIHSHNPFFLGILADKVARLEGLPLVSTYHTLYNHYAHYVFFLPDPAIQGLLKWWLPEYYAKCKVVIVPSRVAEESLLSYGVTTPVRIIPTGVPIPSVDAVSEEAQREARKRFSIPQGAQLLLYVGRVAQEKNLDLVLDAFSILSSEFRKVHLLVVGGGPYLEDATQLALEGAAPDRVHFAGAQPHDGLEALYAAADIFVFGSSTETQGLVIAEARASGTPSVVVDGGGACETVRDEVDGLVVPSELEPFTEAIRRLLLDPDRLDAMNAACRINAHDFTPEAMCRQVLDVYSAARGVADGVLAGAVSI